VETIRAFVAVPVTDQVRQLVFDVEGDLKTVAANVKWVRPENVHVTLKFLGNITPEDVESLCRTLPDALRGQDSFDVILAGTGTFPPGRKAPRVVWIGMQEGRDRLVEVAGRVEAATLSLGFEKEERPFRPHLTIGRVRRGSGRLRELADRVAGLEFNPLKLGVDRVNLMRSRLSPQGPTYTVLGSFALGH
jgi:2'-5' RNA ligase